MLLPESEFGFADVLVPASEEAGVQYGDSYELNLNGEDLSELSDGGAWEDQYSVSSGPSPMTPEGGLAGVHTLDNSQRSSGYEQFLQVFQGEGDLPAELADDDLEYHVDPESYAAVPDEWYNLAGRISRTEVEELLRDGGGDGSSRAGIYDSAAPSTSAPRAAYSEPLVQLSDSQRYLLHQQTLQMVQLQVQLYLLSRHMEGQDQVADDLWTTHNRFVALSTSASTSYRPPPRTLALPMPAPQQETQNTAPNVAVFSVTMPAPGTSSLLVAPPSGSSQHSSESLTLYNPSSTDHVGELDSSAPGASSSSISAPSELSVSQLDGLTNPSGDRRAEAARSLRPFLASVLALPTVVLLNQEVLARLHATPGKISISELNRYVGMYSSLFRPTLHPKVDARAALTTMTSTSVTSAHGMMTTGNPLRLRWTSVEDDLLAIGVNLFHKNWPLIRQRLLPCKHATAIGTRFKYKTSKKSKDNPVKAIHAYNKRPLSNHERDLLQLGVAQCGHNFALVAEKFLPSRKEHFLAKVWRQMTAATSKPKKLTSHRLTAPASTHNTLTVRQHSPSGSGSTTPVRTPVQDPMSPGAATSAHPEPTSSKNARVSVKPSGSDDEGSDSESVMRSRRRRAAAAAQAQPSYGEDEEERPVTPSMHYDNNQAGSLADRNRALQHYDAITRTRPGGSDSSSDDEHMQWDSEESSDLHIIESARGSSASDSGSDDNDGRLMKYSRPPKRFQYHELSDSESPRANLNPEARVRHEMRDPAVEDRNQRYPEDYHLRKFHASTYLSMLLDWEVVWQEEAVKAAMAAAETATLERLSGKVKPVGSSKAKSRSKGSRHSKSKAEANAIPTVISAANAEWDHELWVTPPPSPPPSAATATMELVGDHMSAMQGMSSASGYVTSDGSSVGYASMPPQSVYHTDPSQMQMADGSMDGSFSVRMAAPAGYDNGYGAAPPATGQFRVPMSAQPPSHMPQSMSSQVPQYATQYAVPLQGDNGMPHPGMRAAAAPSAAFGDSGIVMMQRSLEKEVRNAQMHRSGSAKSTGAYRPTQHPPNTGMPSGLFSVLTPEGQLITTPMNQPNSMEEPKY